MSTSNDIYYYINLNKKKKQPYKSWKYQSKQSNNHFKTKKISTKTNVFLYYSNSDEFKNNSGNHFRARPIKHWRKQLFPLYSNKYIHNSKISIREIFDSPSNSIIENNILDCDVNFVENYIIENSNNSLCCYTKNSNNPLIVRSASTKLKKIIIRVTLVI